MKRVLVITPHPQFFDASKKLFPEGFQVEVLRNILSGFEAFQKTNYDFTFVDVSFLEASNFPGADNPDDILNEFHKLHPNSHLIVLSQQDEVATAVGFVEKGAKGYLNYPVDPSELGLIMDRVGTTERRIAELNYLRDEFWTDEYRDVADTKNKVMGDIFQSIKDVASTKSTVLITGETGAGKGVLARMIHQHSSRKKNQFIHVHCGAILESLIESELFGHEKGAFTGAINRKLGKFELATKGTIFLDEVSTLTPSAQIKLLQVLQDSKFQRVGGEVDVNVDIRVIAATNEDLKKLCEEGKFRKDLYYRLNVFPLYLPALKERLEDLPQLVDNFIKRLNLSYQKNIQGIQPEALTGLLEYDWPGNIRELENLVERAYIIEKSPLLTTESFPLEIFDDQKATAVLPLNSDLPLPEARSRTVENFERQYLKEVLSKTNGKVSRAAEMSGVGVRQFNKLMVKYGLKKEDFKEPVLQNEHMNALR